MAFPRPAHVERILPVPREWREPLNQGREGACVGFSQSWMMGILNGYLYDAPWLYRKAQAIDEYPDTPPAEGTSLRAGFDVLRTKGHRRAGRWLSRRSHGILSNEWTTSVDAIVAEIANGVPVNLGINWYRQFGNPAQRPRADRSGADLAPTYDYWIGLPDVQWGRVDGGHAITVVGASDTRQALALCNTWGGAYPFLVWLPYTAMERLFAEDGEAGIVTDRP